MPVPLLTERLCLVAEPIVDLRAGLRVGEELVPVVSSSDHGAPQPFWERFDLDRWIIEHAARLAAADREVHVSVSAASVGRYDFADRIEGALHNAGAGASTVTIAVDEQVFARDAASAARFALEISRIGMRLAVCDFVLRPDSASYLGGLPVQDLKIDTSLIRALTTDRECAATVARIVKLARDHGQRTVAESPGDLETLVALYEMGVDCAQGFWPSSRHK
jgi:EAL domain-containing protein (putative c-di-GMP-specific phosphodiesterase class I)